MLSADAGANSAGKRSRGWTMQERAFAPTQEVHSLSSSRASESLFGSDTAQPSSHQLDVALQRSSKLQRRDPQEGGVAGSMCISGAFSMAEPPRSADIQAQQQRQTAKLDPGQPRQFDAHCAASAETERHTSDRPQPLQERDQHQNSRQQHPHQQHHQHPQPHWTQAHVCQQKAILPGVLASLVQTQRSSQRPYPPVPPRPPLGPSAPSRARRDAHAADAAADQVRGGAATSHAGGSGGGSSQMQPPASLRRQHQCQAGLQQQQHQGGHGARVPPRNLSVQIPVANPVHVQLYSFFSRRRRQLQQLGLRPSRYARPLQAGPRNGLLALPEDVLVNTGPGPSCCHRMTAPAQRTCTWEMYFMLSRVVSMLRLMAAPAAVQLKVICTLRHQEIGNLFGVCKELRSTVRLPQSHVPV
jgi:hypothetical protein